MQHALENLMDRVPFELEWLGAAVVLLAACRWLFRRLALPQDSGALTGSVIGAAGGAALAVLEVRGGKTGSDGALGAFDFIFTLLLVVPFAAFGAWVGRVAVGGFGGTWVRAGLWAIIGALIGLLFSFPVLLAGGNDIALSITPTLGAILACRSGSGRPE